MPRIGVNTLRWLLLAGNCAALVGLGWLGWNLFVPGRADQLRIALPDPASVAVAAEERTTFDAKDLNKILRVHKDQPRAKPEPRPIETELPPVAAGGPLSGWEVAVTIVSDEGRFASLSEKVEQSIVDTRRPSVGPPNVRSSSRGRPSRVRPAPRRAVPTTASRSKWVAEGETFTIDGFDYIALKIDSRPSRLEYQEASNGLRHFITGAENPWLGYEMAQRGNGVLLRGLDDEELGVDPAANPLGALGGISPDERGELRSTTPGATGQPRQAPAGQPSRSAEERRREAVEEMERRKAAKEEIRDVKGIPDTEREELERQLEGQPKKKED